MENSIHVVELLQEVNNVEVQKLSDFQIIQVKPCYGKQRPRRRAPQGGQ